MYGYRQAINNPLMTNLNSISSSISSLDTIGRRNPIKASADNLINPRTKSTTSTSLLWRANKDERYSTTGSVLNGTSRNLGSEIYYSGDKASFTRSCLNPESAFDLILVPFLLLTIARQVMDFLGQIWLQILINFLTILITIVALFGMRQRRASYLDLFCLWSLFNIIWNLAVFCIHSRIKDVAMTEETLSLYTGATSWWQSNGPGCLPYNISSIKPPIGVIQPSIVTGCRFDYHLIESTQAILHACISMAGFMVSCCVRLKLRRNLGRKLQSEQRNEKAYRLNNLANDRTRVNQDPFPVHKPSRTAASHTASLRRAPNKASSRSSQHSVSSSRSARRRQRMSVDGTLPTPRGSTSSAQRSQKYGSLSSRRSNRRERRSENSSITYGVTGEKASSNQRNRLSSLSSTEYLPSYQPPHSSSANLLSSYGELSSIDSYNNQTTRPKQRQTSIKAIPKGNTNPTYNGSRSSVCSQNTNAHNYDDLSHLYGNNNSIAHGDKGHDTLYSSRNMSDGLRQNHTTRSTYHNKNHLNRAGDQFQNGTIDVRAETYRPVSNGIHREDRLMKPKGSVITNGSFQSFTSSRAQQNNFTGLKDTNLNKYPQRSYTNGTDDQSGQLGNSNEARSRLLNNPASQFSFSNGETSSRYPIYSNQMQSNGNSSETPI